MQYVNQTVDRFVGYAQAMPGSIANVVRQKHQELLSSSTSRKVEAIRHKINNMWQDNTVRVMWSVGAAQQAPDAMVRWMMANPRIRSLYHDGRVEGYGDRYNDIQPNCVGEEQYDYRRVMDGMIVNTETGSHYTTYHEEIIPDDVVLNTLEKMSIRLSWDIVNKEIEDGNMDDPTSEWNALIG